VPGLLTDKIAFRTSRPANLNRKQKNKANDKDEKCNSMPIDKPTQYRKNKEPAKKSDSPLKQATNRSADNHLILQRAAKEQQSIFKTAIKYIQNAHCEYRIPRR